MFSTVLATGVHGLFEDWWYDPALIRVRAVHVGRVDPPVGEDGTEAVASV